MTEFETSTHENDDSIEIQEVKPKKINFGGYLLLLYLPLLQ